MTGKITLYGIKNCDTIRKARRWLDEHDVIYVFHDFRQGGIDPRLLDVWCDQLGFEALLNKRGTTWRNLPDRAKHNLTVSSAKQIMLDNPSVIKRPVLDLGDLRVVGFSPSEYASLFT